MYLFYFAMYVVRVLYVAGGFVVFGGRTVFCDVLKAMSARLMFTFTFHVFFFGGGVSCTKYEAFSCTIVFVCLDCPYTVNIRGMLGRSWRLESFHWVTEVHTIKVHECMRGLMEA